MAQKMTPRALPLTAIEAAMAPKIVGSSDPKRASPTEANGPMRPVLRPTTASSPSVPCSSWMAMSMPKTKLMKKLEVFISWFSVRIIWRSSGEPSP